jgi:3-oxoacyl-[acyl-carrier protein] reductase
VDLNLKDRIVLVAGSSRGIGKATARAFLAEGCRTAITGRQAEPLARTAAEFEAEFGTDRVLVCEGDMTRTDVIEATLENIRERWGRLDCLVANIGGGRGKSGWNLGSSDWESLFEINFWGSARLVTQVLPEMAESRSGSIVFVASIVGVESTPAPLPYSAAKAALINLSKNLARQAGTYNVRVNCVAPGNVIFPGGSWKKHQADRPEETAHYIETEVPLQRFGRPEEIADVIVFIASDRASFITAACIVVDGGQVRNI